MGMITFRRGAAYIPLVIAALLAIYLIGYLSVEAWRYHWDFGTYYHAARVWEQGGNPYDPAAIQADGARPEFPYLYPPILLPLFSLFTSMSLPTAVQVWLFLRVGLLVLLLMIWRRWFVPVGRDGLFGVFVIVAFWGSIFLDLKAGNVTTIEQLLLWGGLALFLSGRMVWFCLCVVVAAIFKGTPLLFLGLLALPGVRHRVTLMAGSLGLFGLVQAASYLVAPDLFPRYLQAAFNWKERGVDTNPSTLSLLQDVLDPLRLKGLAPGLVDGLTVVVYLAVVAAIFGVSWQAYQKLSAPKKATEQSAVDQRALIILLATLTAALVFPRLKVYTFMMVLPATYYVIRTQTARGALVLWMILLAPVNHSAFPLDQRFVDGLGWYYPLLILYVIWGLWAWRVIASDTHQAETAES